MEILDEAVFVGRNENKTVFDRVERDVERGDLGTARRRLASHLATCGYDPTVLRRLGELSLAMKDPFEAGRYWLLSDVEGEEAEGIIEAFVCKAGPEPRVIAACLPQTCCHELLAEYPPRARERVQRWGLHEQLFVKAVKGTPRAPKSTWDRVAPFVFFGIALGIFLFLLVGAWTVFLTIMGWLGA